MSGHSSYLVWLVYRFRAIARILPNLKQRPKHAWVAPFFLLLLVLLATVGVGVYGDGYVLHPPTHYTGVCPAPAIIRHNGCWIITIVQQTVSGSVTVNTVSTPSGYIILPNGTRGR